MPYLNSDIMDLSKTPKVVGRDSDLKSVKDVRGEVKQLTSFAALEQRRDEDSVGGKFDRDGVSRIDWAEVSSRPPSPPESGTTTPRLKIAPCPDRLREVIPAPNYGTVELRAIYRSSFPQDRNMDFVKCLHIRSVLTLVDTEPSAAYQQWVLDHQIKQTRVDIAPNKDGNVTTTLASLCQALLFVMDSTNYPVYIHCNQGKHRTGCVVACLRKIQRVPMKEILAEYYAYAWPKVRPGDIHLIKSFNPDLVFDYAKENGYFGGEHPRLKRLDSTITDIDALAAALSSGALIDGSELSDASADVNFSIISRASSDSSDGALEMGGGVNGISFEQDTDLVLDCVMD